MSHLSPEQSTAEATPPVNCSPEIIQDAKAYVAQLTGQLDEAKETLRMLLKQRSDAAPFQCAVCGEGMYADDPRHTHYAKRRNSEVAFIAMVIPRPKKNTIPQIQ